MQHTPWKAQGAAATYPHTPCIHPCSYTNLWFTNLRFLQIKVVFWLIRMETYLNNDLNLEAPTQNLLSLPPLASLQHCLYICLRASLVLGWARVPPDHSDRIPMIILWLSRELTHVLRRPSFTSQLKLGVKLKPGLLGYPVNKIC